VGGGVFFGVVGGGFVFFVCSFWGCLGGCLNRCHPTPPTFSDPRSGLMRVKAKQGGVGNFRPGGRQSTPLCIRRVFPAVRFPLLF